MSTSARIFGTPLLRNQNNGGAQMTAIKTATRKGTRMGLAAFIPATRMTKLARITGRDVLAVVFTLSYP